MRSSFYFDVNMLLGLKFECKNFSFHNFSNLEDESFKISDETEA